MQIDLLWSVTKTGFLRATIIWHCGTWSPGLFHQFGIHWFEKEQSLCLVCTGFKIKFFVFRRKLGIQPCFATCSEFMFGEELFLICHDQGTEVWVSWLPLYNEVDQQHAVLLTCHSALDPHSLAIALGCGCALGNTYHFWNGPALMEAKMQSTSFEHVKPNLPDKI